LNDRSGAGRRRQIASRAGRAYQSSLAVAGFSSYCNFITVSPSQGKDLTGYVLRTVYQYLNSYDFAFLTSRDIIKSKLARKKKEKKPMAIVFSLKNLSIRNKILAHLRIDTPKRFRPAQPMRPRQRITVAEKGQHQKKNVRAKQPWFVAKILRLNKVLFAQRSDRSRATDATYCSIVLENCLVRWGIRIKSV
jgi:hypothetical protein